MKLYPSHYNGAILKKLVVFLKMVEVVHLKLGCNKEEESLRYNTWEVLLRLGGNYDVLEWAVASPMSFTTQRLPLSA